MAGTQSEFGATIKEGQCPELNCVPRQFICRSSHLQDLRMGLYLCHGIVDPNYLPWPGLLAQAVSQQDIPIREVVLPLKSNQENSVGGPTEGGDDQPPRVFLAGILPG